MEKILKNHVDSYKLSQVIKKIEAVLKRYPNFETDPELQVKAWIHLTGEVLTDSSLNLKFGAHKALYYFVFQNRMVNHGPPIAWLPTDEILSRSNIKKLMSESGFDSYEQLHGWSVENREAFWETAIKKLSIIFKREPDRIIDSESAIENPRWLPGARINIVDSCFKARAEKTAIVTGKEGSDDLKRMTYGELDILTNRIANGLFECGFKSGDAIAIYTPMTAKCVAIYLGIIRAGCAVVSIADSFQPDQIKTRLKISKAKAIFTVNDYKRGGKSFPLFLKVKNAEAPRSIVIRTSPERPELRKGDLLWTDFLSENESFKSIARDPYDAINILFSSGTTAEPKAIPWNHLTPIKSAADGYFHQDIHEEDKVAWPTNIGWMMGPWLIFASLINNATVALYDGAPFGSGFGKFVQDAKISMLGVIPAIVKRWRESKEMEKYNWSSIKVFSSTGECSNSEDYLYLMSLAGYNAPVIEYCGGTEIGGGHITGAVVQPASPATFTTPALGLDFVILNEKGKCIREGETGEIFLIPPSIGLSQVLLNKNHHEVYFKDCPAGPEGEILRRHGDEVGKLHNGFFQGNGRADDTMNLAGIKVSSATLERVMSENSSVYEVAAVGVQPPEGGADKFVVYVVINKKIAKKKLQEELQILIKKNLSPLFKINDVIIVDSLPRTASNKIMRRKLKTVSF